MSAKCAPGCTCGRHRRLTYGGKPFTQQAPDERRAKQREYDRAYRASHPERNKYRRESRQRYVEKNREKIRVKNREYLKTRRGRHALKPGDFEAMWQGQGGLCCYCRQPLPREGGSGKVVIDHDHTCCGPSASCRFCRRGLACNNCNVIVGMAAEDPDRLEVVAANFRAIAAETRERMTGKPVQAELPINVARLPRRKESA